MPSLGNREGAQVLLQDVADGKASARLLQERNIKERLVAANPPDVAERISKLTKNLPPAADARQKVIDARRAALNPRWPRAHKEPRPLKRIAPFVIPLRAWAQTLPHDWTAPEAVARMIA